MKTIVLLTVLLTTPIWVAQAQTARIAHLSHSGNLETLAVTAVDNFGIPPSHFVADSIEILSDSTAREYGQWTGYHQAEKTNVVQYHYAGRGYGKSTRDYIAGQQKYRPQVKVIRRDTATATPAPVLKKPKTKRKKAAFLPTAPAPPQHPGVALAVVGILVCAGAGWLLGERRPQTQAV